MKEYYRVWAEIDLDAIVTNIKKTRELIPANTGIMAIIKADGYGHGAVPIAKVLDDFVDAYGVAILEEGIELRRAGITKPILILGITPPLLFAQMIQYDIMPTVCSKEMAWQISEEAIRQNKTANIHIKVDTGMGRIGFFCTRESVSEIKELSQFNGIVIHGLFTHFTKADSKDKSYFKQQFAAYNQFCKWLEEEELSIPIRHAANSAAIIDLPEAHLDMVRSGISTYGIYPSEEVKKENLLLKPAMSLFSSLTYIKTVPKGTKIGYGSTYETKRETIVATIPVGYADGYKRALSNCGRVLIHGISCPVIGRVCMDQFMVDVTNVKEVKVGERVTLLGTDGAETIYVEELANLSHSFSYEFVCNISKRVPRVYYYKGKKAGTLDFYNCMEQTFQLKI